MKIGTKCLDWLKKARQRGASDLLIVAGSAPSVYVNTRLEPLEEGVLTAKEAREVILQMVDESMREQLESRRDLDFSFGHAEIGRCRVNVHYQRSSLAAAIRFVSDAAPSFEDLNLPDVMRSFAQFPRGLVLITGGTGSGKSTSLAAIIEQINRSTAAHIITLEDPIEFAFRNDRCIIEQREIGADSPSFPDALRHIVRQKPDIIMIGEMRDLETIRAAITAAEMGHLVLATLHTMGAAQTVQRIVEVFGPAQEAQIRIHLAGALQAIACQTLFEQADGAGLIPAVELLINTPAVARAIRDGETHLITGMIETGSHAGMQTSDQDIMRLIQQELITPEAGLSKAVDRERMQRKLSGGSDSLTSVGAGAPASWD